MKKLAVITGGTGDIAKSIAYELQAYGDYSAILPNRDELNVGDLDSVNHFFKDKKVDLLINNAGSILLEPVCNKIISHAEVINTNLIGVFFCTNAVLINNPDACVINIGSSAGTKVHAGWSSYCASKAGLIMATKCWAAEGVNAICISPGRTLTKMRKSMYPDEDPNTLMTPVDFAKFVVKKIRDGFIPGDNIDVNVSNVKGLINE